MSFFSRLIPPSRKAEKNFWRGRDAEMRADFDGARQCFQLAAEAFDEDLSAKATKGDDVRPSHLVMAGICYTRLGRNEDALKVLDQCIALKEIPDAFLHAGYAAAKLGRTDQAADYWSRYPKWIEQPVIHTALKDQLACIRGSDACDLQAACEAVAKAVHRQDKENRKASHFDKRGSHTIPPNRGY